MRHRKLYAGIVASGILFAAASGLADYRSLPYLAGGVAGILLLLKLRELAGRRNRSALRVNPKLALLAVSTLISLIAAEAALQVFFFDHIPRISSLEGNKNAYDPNLGWFPVPNYRAPGGGTSQANNSLGLRGGEFQRTGKAGILFLGDSFVWGFHIDDVEERFTNKIQAKHRDWNAYNVGVIGYGTDQELLLLQRIFDRLNPRIVFLLFCTENDHRDNSANISYGCYKPYFTTNSTGVELHGVPVPYSEILYCAEHPLLSRSYLFRLLVRVWKKFTTPSPATHDDPTPALILEMKNYVQKKGACFVVGLTAPDPVVEHLLKEQGIPWIDLNTTFRFPDDRDGHWTAQGNSFAAGRIEQFLLTNTVVSRFLPK